MIKTIHMIMLGSKSISNIMLENINSFKRVYPDWNIKIWTDEECIDWIKESSFASYYYFDCPVLAYASDYLRNRIVYECGGMYVDIDVFAYKRIPDEYFRKPFLAWDLWGVTTNNGTCLYAPEPHLPIFKEFCDCMADTSTEIILNGGSGAANDRINAVLFKHGFDIKGNPDETQDLDEITIVNRNQFGGSLGHKDGIVSKGKEVYLLHSCLGSWTIPSYVNGIHLHYALVDKNTDFELLRKKAKEIKGLPYNNVLMLIITGFVELDGETLNTLKELGWRYIIYISLGDNPRGSALEILARRVADVRICRDVMRETWTK